MTLFEECIEALGPATEVLGQSKSRDKARELQQNFPFTTWGRIDWHKIKGLLVETTSELQDFFEDSICYLIWDSAELPVVKTTVRSMVAAIEDVKAVSFDTWVLSSNGKTVVEFYHEGDVVVASPSLAFAN